MCINKRHIINKGFRPLDPKTTQYIDVNCGHCLQCESERSAAYAYRMQVEVNSHPDCMPFYVTFSYAPYYLPILEYFDDNHEIKSLSVWNRQHITRLNKVLRRQLEYYYGYTCAFKTLCCCERGSDREYIDDFGRYRVATERPHYHCMYVLYNVSTLVPIRDLPPAFYDFVKKNNCGVNIRSFFHYLLASRWKYGNILDLEVTRSVSTCTRYIAQYCTKNINENVFNIPLSSIYRYIDNDYNDRYKIFQSRYLARINAFGWMDNQFRSKAKSLRYLSLYRCSSENRSWIFGYLKRNKKPFKSLMSFCVAKHWQGQISLCRKAPAPIRFCHLTPRSTQSINLGFPDSPSFLHKAVDILASGQTVTLSGSKKASKIPFPFYYYKKICKQSGIVKDNIFYPTYDGKRSHIQFSESYLRPVQDWNNVDGCFLDFRKKVYTLSWFTRIGQYVRFKTYRNKIHRTVSSLKCMLFNKDYFYNLISEFNSLDTSVQNGMTNLVFDASFIDRSYSWLSTKLDELPILLKKYFHFDYKELSCLSGDFKYLDCLIKTFSLCRTTFSYLNQLKYRELFKKQLGRKGLQDPELLIPHFINVYKYG